jgi:hypothetical protein
MPVLETEEVMVETSACGIVTCGLWLMPAFRHGDLQRSPGESARVQPTRGTRPARRDWSLD